MEWLGFAAAPLCFAAFCAAALSIDRHHRQVTGGACPADRRKRLKAISAGGLALATALSLAGGGIGVVTGVLSAGVAAAAVMGVLVLQPKLLRLALLQKPSQA